METSYTQLRNGILVPTEKVLDYSKDTYRLFADKNYLWTEYLARLSVAAKDNFSPEACAAHMPSPIVVSLMSQHYDILPLKQRSTHSMARTAVAACMVNATVFEGEFDAYIQDPVDDSNGILDQMTN